MKIKPGSIESRARQILGSLAIEGIHSTPEDLKKIEAILRGEIDGEAELKRVVAQYTQEDKKL